MDPALLSVIVAAVLTYICGWLLYRVDKAHPASEKTAPVRPPPPILPKVTYSADNNRSPLPDHHIVKTEQRIPIGTVVSLPGGGIGIVTQSHFDVDGTAIVADKITMTPPDWPRMLHPHTRSLGVCCLATKSRNRHACFCAVCGNRLIPATK